MSIFEQPINMDDETFDEILAGRLRVFQKKRGYRFSLDAILLAHFVCLKSKSTAIDLGTGSGIIPLILAIRFPQASFAGLEIQAGLTLLAQRNVQFNGLQEQINIVTGDAGKIKDYFPTHSFDAVIFNPPYRKINSGRINPDWEKAVARHEIKGSLRDFLRAAKYLLKPAGKVFTIYPATRLAELVSCLRANLIEPKRMKFVFSDETTAAEFVLTEGRAESREELKIEPSLIIYDQERKYTNQMKDIFSVCAEVASGGDG